MTSSLAFIYLLIVFLSVVAIRTGNGTAVFSFPFLFAAVWIGFVLVGFTEFIRFAGELYLTYDYLGVIDLALFMLVTCIFGGLGGYLMAGGGEPREDQQPVPGTVDPHVMKYMHYASIVLAIMSYTAFVMLAGLGGGLQAYLFESGLYSIQLEGLPVYLIFVTRFGYVSIAMQLWLWSRTGRRSHLFWALAFSIIPFINIIFIFRRSEVVKVGVYFGYFIVNYTRIRIGTAHMLAALTGMYVVFRLFPLLRSEANQARGLDILLGEALAQRTSFENHEIGGGLFRMYQSIDQNFYEYGAIFYNSVVKQFIPGQLVGADFKQSLLIPTIENVDTSFAQFLFYVSPMGFAQAFQQFWLFGGVIFVVLGWMLARMEQRRFTSPRAEILLVLMIPEVLATVSADLSLIASRLVTYVILIWLCIPKAALRPWTPMRGPWARHA